MTPKVSDSYFTDAPILNAMLELWPKGPDLDPCFEEGCSVKARLRYDIRRGQDGRVLPWKGRTFCNAPFSDLSSFAAKAVAHSIAGGEVLFVCPVSSDTRWWQNFIMPHGVVCLLSFRAKFWKPGATKPTASMTSIAVVHFSQDAQKSEAFMRVFGKLGTIVRRVDMPAEVTA